VVTLWTSVPEALGSNVGQDIGYPDLGFPWLFAVPLVKCQIGASIGPGFLNFDIISSSSFRVILPFAAVHSSY
jgi:hypothetical protein